MHARQQLQCTCLAFALNPISPLFHSDALAENALHAQSCLVHLHKISGSKQLLGKAVAKSPVVLLGYQHLAESSLLASTAGSA